jgi:hypothetical protein
MRGFAPARREPFLVAKKVHKKARHISSFSVTVVIRHNAKTLPRRIFAFIVLTHNSHAGNLPQCHS